MTVSATLTTSASRRNWTSEIAAKTTSRVDSGELASQRMTGPFSDAPTRVALNRRTARRRPSQAGATPASGPARPAERRQARTSGARAGRTRTTATSSGRSRGSVSRSRGRVLEVVRRLGVAGVCRCGTGHAGEVSVGRPARCCSPDTAPAVSAADSAASSRS